MELTMIILSLVLNAFALGSLFFLWVQVRSMQQSTHQVTMHHPFGKAPDFETMTDELKEELTKNPLTM